MLEETESESGATLQFEDEPWDRRAVEIHVVFCGMTVTVDGHERVHPPFISGHATHHADLGCRIEVRESQDLDSWHRSCKRGRWHWVNVLVNSHGQAVALNHYPVNPRGLHYYTTMSM